MKLTRFRAALRLSCSLPVLLSLMAATAAGAAAIDPALQTAPAAVAAISDSRTGSEQDRRNAALKRVSFM